MNCPFRVALTAVALVSLGLAPLRAQAPAASKLTPNLVGQLERPLRYTPDGADFVITNGAEFFNRPLYGGNTAFRVDAGDKPEFSLYLPGRGGNLRFGIRTASGAKWLHAAEQIEARYRPGEMRYEIRDALLGANRHLFVEAIALPQAEGLIVRAWCAGKGEAFELIWAYGGANGRRGRRDGDIGTESVPISEYFQLKPEFCRDNTITRGSGDGAFLLRAKTATIAGSVNGGEFAVGNAAQWNDCAALAATPANAPETAQPVAVGRRKLDVEFERFSIVLTRLTGVVAEDLDTYREVTAPPAAGASTAASRAAAPTSSAPAQPTAKLVTAADHETLWSESETYFTQLRDRVQIDTPDPFLNAAVGALNIAADATWDDPQEAIMHGAIAWRTRLLGWRGPYSLTALGWHERARKHFRYWSTRQNTSAIPAALPPPDEDANLARSEVALHSNGDMSNSHYDMNLVYLDALLRYLRWTGDMELARELWPVIERHLAWERRLFRREFKTAKGETLPLYEAYAAIWASDDLQYHGGGTAHGSAYNYFHHHEAAALAKRLGLDGSAYEREAQLIARGMRELLWIDEGGSQRFAEFKDLLGNQLVHPSAALWSVYHVIDSEVPTPKEALAMTEYVERVLPRLPVAGPGVPREFEHAMYASSDWLPYSWSINNVVMGENVHTALAFWQAGNDGAAYRLLRSSLLASMYMGICPGNVGSMNYLDVYRRESQRDFADGSGVTSRALVEGLFGVERDGWTRELRIRPGFPAQWDHAKLKHPDLAFDFRHRDGRTEIEVTQSTAEPLDVRLELPLRSERAIVIADGKPVPSEIVRGTRAASRLIVRLPATAKHRLAIEWSGAPADLHLEDPKTVPPRGSVALQTISSSSPRADAVLEPVDLAATFNDRVTEIFRRGKYRSPRSPFVSLALPAQGIGAWAGHVNEMAEIDDSGLRRIASENDGRFALPNGVKFATPGPGEARNVAFVSQWDNYPRELSAPLSGRAQRVHLLLTGSTNYMQSRLDNGEISVAYADGTTTRFALRNPETWWPIDQDYFIDDYQFASPGALPATRVNLKSGEVRVLDAENFKGQGRKVTGGAATVLPVALDPTKELRSITVRALANEVVIGLMAATLER